MQSGAFWDTIVSLDREYLLDVHWLARRIWRIFSLQLLIYCNDNNIFWGKLGILGEKLLHLKYPR